MNKVLFVLAIGFVAAFAVNADHMKLIEKNQKIMSKLASSERTRSVVFTPAELPCGYVITADVDMSISSGGTSDQYLYVQKMIKMQKSLILHVDLSKPRIQYSVLDYRYDLVFTKSGIKYLPAIEALYVPGEYMDCSGFDLTLDQVDDKEDGLLHLFEQKTTFDSMTTRTFEGKKYFVYSLTVKEPDEVTYVEAFVDDKNYVSFLNTTDIARETITSFARYKYSYDYSLNDFALDTKQFTGCNMSAYSPPPSDPCKQ